MTDWCFQKTKLSPRSGNPQLLICDDPTNVLSTLMMIRSSIHDRVSNPFTFPVTEQPCLSHLDKLRSIGVPVPAAEYL